MAWENTVHNSTPGFVADPESINRNTGRQIDWAVVSDAYLDGVTYQITAGATAAAAATSITVAALPVALPTGTVLDFEGAEAVLTAPAAVGATTLTVAPLAAEVASGKIAKHIVSQSGKKVIPAGTVMVQIAATGKIVPRAVRPGSENAAMILWTTATEDSRTDAKSGYGCLVGGVIYEDLLPETITAWKSELATAGALFQYEKYADSREPA